MYRLILSSFYMPTNKSRFTYLHLFLISIVLLFSSLTEVKAQGKLSTIQLSGLVVDGDSSYGVPGVHIYVERAGLGTTTNAVGFFSLPALVGDTVTISAIGYQKQQLIVPRIQDRGFTVLIDLKTDTTFLPIVEVFPYSTVELFKEAFLALELPDDRYKNMRKNLDPEMMTAMAMSMPMTSSMNQRYAMDQHINRTSNRFFSPSFSFLNPFAWAEFIKSVKNGDLKSKD